MINFKAHPNLGGKPPETLEGIERCVTSGTPFILYANQREFVVFLPKEFKIVQFDHGDFMIIDGISGMAGFKERIKFYIMAYEQFEEAPAGRIENGKLYLE